MERKRIMRCILAFTLSAAMTAAGIQLPAVSAFAAEPGETEVQRNISLPLELYDYQSDGLLFQYDLAGKWTLTHPVAGGEFWNVLSEAAREELKDTNVVYHEQLNSYIIEGLVEAADEAGLTYKDGTYELLSWYLMDTIQSIDPTFPMIDEEHAVFVWEGNTYDWNYQDYEKWSVDETFKEMEILLAKLEKNGSLTGEEEAAYNTNLAYYNENRAYYEMYFKDYYTYDYDPAEGMGVDNIRLCKLYFDYYVAKVQWKFGNHLKTQAQELAANAAKKEDDAKTLLGIIKSAIDAYNGYVGLLGTGNENVTGAGVADVCRIDDTLRYYYGGDNAELDAAGYYHVPLTGGMPGGNDAGYQADLAYVKNLTDSNPELWAQLLEIIFQTGRGRILDTADDRILDTETVNGVVNYITWDTYYNMVNFVPGFDYIYTHMAYGANSDSLPDGFADWYTEDVQTAAANYDVNYDVTDTTNYHIIWKASERCLELGANPHSGRVGAKRTFSLEPGTYTVEWSVKNSPCNILLTDEGGNALAGLDKVESPVGVGHSAVFTLDAATDVTVMFYYETENNWTDVYNFRIKDSDGNYVTKNSSYGEFYDSGVPYRWTAVVDEAADGTYARNVAFDGVQAPVRIPAGDTGNFYGFRPLKLNGMENGTISLTLQVMPGKEYRITYGQAAYNTRDVLITDESAGSMEAILNGAVLSGDMSLAKGVTQIAGEGIETVFTASSYNVDAIHANDNGDALTSYCFVPEGDTVTLTFAASSAGGEYWGWVNGLTVESTDGSNVILDIPTKADSDEYAGWVPVLNGSTAGVSVGISGTYQDSVGVQKNPVTAGSNGEFKLDDACRVLNIHGNGSGERLCSSYFNMNLGDQYTISYEVCMTSINSPGASMVGYLETAQGENAVELPVRKGTDAADGRIGSYKIDKITDNGDGTYWVSLSYTFTSLWESARLVMPDTAGDFAIRNIKVTAAAGKSYVRGNVTEAQAAAAYAQEKGTAGSGIRQLVDLFVEYHANAGDANGMTAYDYVYYMLKNLFNGNSVAAKKIDAYDNLILEPVTNEITTVTSKKTGDTYELATHGFYATSIENKTDAEGNIIERNQATVVLNPKSADHLTGTISNDLSGTGGQRQLFPLDGLGYGAPVDNTLYYGRNYNYVMHSGGRFVYHEADNLVFMFTGDDDVYLFLNDKLALDLGGAHMAYSDYLFVNDAAEELGLKEGGVYNFDFYYMERHTTESELKVVTNINVLDAKAILTKGASGAYYAGEDGGTGTPVSWKKAGSDTVDGERQSIPNGSAVPEGQKMYYLQLTGGEVPLDEIRFDDETLGVHIGAGLYEYDEDGNLKKAKDGEITLNPETALTDLRISITDQEGAERIVHQLAEDGSCACGETGLTEDGYKTHLLTDVFGEGAGIEENEKLTVDGIRYTVTAGLTNTATAQALIRDYETARDSGLISADTPEQLGINRAYHSMNVDEQYYVEGNAVNHEDGYVLVDILSNEDFNGKSYSELTEDEREALIFKAYDADGNLISEGAEATVSFNKDNGTISFKPEDLTKEGSSGAYTTTIYYDFDSTLTINGVLYASNPVPVTLNVYALKDDVYVLDYGLGVSLTGGQGDLFANDKYDIPEAEGDTDPEIIAKRNRTESYLGISDGTKDPEGRLNYITRGDVAGADGVLKTDQALSFNLKSYADNGEMVSVQYQPNDFMESIEKFAYGVEIKDSADAILTEKQDTGIRLNGNITIMPATVVYYEDNFTGIVTGGTEAVTEKANLIAADKEWKRCINGVESYGTDYSTPMEINAIEGGADWSSYLQYTDDQIFNGLEVGKTYTITASVYSSIARTIAVASDNGREFYEAVALNPGMNYITVHYTKVNTDSQNGQLLTFFLGNPNHTGNQAPAYYSGENPLGAHTLMIQNVAFTEERLQDNSLDTQYGYDAAYGADSTYSNNGYTLMNGTDKFAFTFKGTGFDLLARATDQNASVRVSVYMASEVELKSYQIEKDGQYENRVSVVKREGVDSVEAVNQVLVNTYYENGTIYQVPVISMTMPDCGEYVVVAQYVGTATDGDNTKALYMDGVRIYNPLNETAGYLADERDAQTKEIRQMVLGDSYRFDYTAPSDPADSAHSATASLIKIEENGQFNISYGQTVVEGFTGHITSAEIAQAGSPVSTDSLLSYAVNGPNNELYLTNGDAGYAWGTVITATGDTPAVQIGLKAAAGTPVVSYMNNDGNWVPLEGLGADGSLVTAARRYYRIPALDELYHVGDKAVLLLQAEGGIASLTTVKYSQVTFAPVTSLGEDAVVYDAAKTPFSILRKGTSGTTTTLTFSVKNTITDFTIKGGQDMDFTYGGEQALPGGVKVSARETDTTTIYVVKMPKQAGTYTITTADSAGYSAATFTIE